MKINGIDNGAEFDFGKTSRDYVRYRDIYPDSMYRKLGELGVIVKGARVLDLGSGTCIIPIRAASSGAYFTAADISEEQIAQGRARIAELGINNIETRVCPAEDTGLPDDSFDAVTAVQCFHYFDSEKAADEILRVLKPGGRFCMVFMDWMPCEDEKIAEMEKLVLKYNPGWNGCGFDRYRYSYPKWAEGRFRIDTIHSYNAELSFTKEAWLGRVMTCRGVGASLSEEMAEQFKREYGAVLQKYDEPLRLLHQVHIEVYISDKKGAREHG